MKNLKRIGITTVMVLVMVGAIAGCICPDGGGFAGNLDDCRSLDEVREQRGQ